MKNYQKSKKVRNKKIVNLRDISKWSFRRIGQKFNISGERARKMYYKTKKEEKFNWNKVDVDPNGDVN